MASAGIIGAARIVIFGIVVRSDLGRSKELMPMQAAAILGHELVHVAVGVTVGRWKEFHRVARGIGLVGQVTATTAGRNRGGAATDTGRGRAVAPLQTAVDPWC